MPLFLFTREEEPESDIYLGWKGEKWTIRTPEKTMKLKWVTTQNIHLFVFLKKSSQEGGGVTGGEVQHYSNHAEKTNKKINWKK